MRVFSAASSNLLLLISTLFLAVTTNAQSSVELTDGTGATADILGQSGKITMSLNGESVQVTMDSMYESDASGNKIQTSGPATGKHSFNSFASQDFVFSSAVDTTYQGIPVTMVNFSASLVNNVADLRVGMYIMLDDGVLTNNGTSYNVTRGSFKFSYYISDWPFCSDPPTSDATDCKQGNTQQVGEFLNFQIALKNLATSTAAVVNSSAAGGAATSLTYSDETVVTMPTAYTANGQWREMPAGSPAITQQGSQAIITFTFQRFNGTVYYDPFVAIDATGESNNAGSSVTFFSWVNVCIVALALLYQLW